MHKIGKVDVKAFSAIGHGEDYEVTVTYLFVGANGDKEKVELTMESFHQDKAPSLVAISDDGEYLLVGCVLRRRGPGVEGVTPVRRSLRLVCLKKAGNGVYVQAERPKGMFPDKLQPKRMIVA